MDSSGYWTHSEARARSAVRQPTDQRYRIGSNLTYVNRMLPARRTLGALSALTAGALLLAACTTGTDSSVEPIAAPVYPQLSTDADIPVVQDIAYSDRDDQTQYLDLCLPPETDGAATDPRPAVLVIHGGSWRRGDKAAISWRAVCQWLASEGFVTASVNYRLAPQWTFPAQLDDVKDAVRWLREPDVAAQYSIDAARIGVLGGSAGGNLAALLGTSGSGDWESVARVAAVVDLSGPALLQSPIVASTGADPDFVAVQLEYLGCASFDPCETAALASPLTYADETDPPFLVAHSTDEFIPLAQSRELVDGLRAVGVDADFVEVAGSAHSIAMLDDAMKERIAAFLRTALRPDPLDPR